MPDGSPLPSELFQFTSEEVVMVPGILDALVPPHLKGVSSVYRPASSSLGPAASSSSTASLPVAAMQAATAAVAAAPVPAPTGQTQVAVTESEAAAETSQLPAQQQQSV